MPTVSVITAAYNSARWLPDAVASVRAQTCDDWELIVVDDASTDDTPALLRRLAGTEPRLRALRFARNQGSGAARNAAWRAACGEWIAVLDADDTWAPDKLARQLAALADRADAQWSAHAVRLVRDGQVLGTRAPQPTRDLLGALARADDHLVHSSVMYRRTALAAVGGFDPSLRRSQDWELFLRLADRYGPAAVVLLPDALADYRLRHDVLPRRLAAVGQRCQGRVVLQRWLRCGWLWRRPRLAWQLLDGYVDRVIEWQSEPPVPASAVGWALLAVLLAPVRRWRWRRVRQLAKAVGATEES